MSPHPFLNRLSLAAQLATVLLLGLMAGFFATYSANVNLATLELDGPTYALVQSAFNRNVRHAGFFACFFGPVPLGLVALAAGWSQRRTAWWWLLALTVVAYALGIVLFTRQVNLPLNYLTESWTAATLPPDWASVRAAWNQANLWRSGLSFALFVAGLTGLVLRLQSRAPLSKDRP
ncbi:anthrone oxygenase family protein [Hydrogenophaga sp.]|uniref:anthrone oxygenase family protein n=1 Tax=Hydrogenophaga sp. TaxID=1904254 RepID=UPI0035B349CA